MNAADGNGVRSGPVREFASLEERLAAERSGRSEAEAAIALIDELLAVLAHELRSPLVSILGFLDVLARRPDDVDVRARALETLRRNARIETQIVDDLLDLTRLLTGRLVIESRPCELGPVVREALEAGRSVADGREVTLVGPEQPTSVVVRGDPRRLQQLVRYLVLMAVKLRTRGGLVAVSVEARESWAEVAVTRGLEGIELDVLTALFADYDGRDPGRLRQNGAAGLNAIVAQRLAMLHGGSIRAGRAGPEGAQIVLRLPAVPGAAPTSGALPD